MKRIFCPLSSLLYDSYSKLSHVAPSLKDGFLEKATKTEIHPGEGTHIPFLSPHWVKTGDQVSASVSIIFNTKETQKQSLALRFNELIHRRLGIHLNPVTGSRSSIDAIKSFLFRALLKLTRGRT